ncbi:MAG: ATP-binding cassette domain-containing protein [Planctomycetota bacterium]|jgi:ABC-2 type transport system ATP-binding protein
MIEVKELRRSFGPVIAVDGISLEVEKGQVLGLLGPNGAGKTTAMRMLACFLRPDSGTASVFAGIQRDDGRGVFELCLRCQRD